MMAPEEKAVVEAAQKLVHTEGLARTRSFGLLREAVNALEEAKLPRLSTVEFTEDFTLNPTYQCLECGALIGGTAIGLHREHHANFEKAINLALAVRHGD